MIQTAGICREKIFLSIISGIVLTIGFPKIGFSYAPWFAMVFLLLAIRDVSVRSSFLLGIVAGMVHFATMLYWLMGTMHTYGYLPLWLSVIIFIPLVFYLSLYVAAFAAMVRFFCSGAFCSLLLIPVFWICLEYIRSVAVTGFPWGLIGYTQAEHLYLIQISDICGVYGVSFVIALANAVIFYGLLYFKKEKWNGCRVNGRQTMASLLIILSVLASLLGYGRNRLESAGAMINASEKIDVAVIQGNIEQAAKWDLKFRTDTIEKYVRLSEQANKHGPDLIVWPETATPFYFKYHIELTKMVLKAIRSMKTYFIIGSPTVEVDKYGEHYYNSAYLISPKGDIESRNDKVHLVPFGEYVPFKKWLPFVNHIVAQVGEFKSGQRGDTLGWESGDIGVLICYEVIFPELAREMVSNDAGLMVNITNDAWFGKTSAPYQHFDMAIFRAVENRRSLIRAANTGISGFIDPAGRVLGRSTLFEEDSMVFNVPVVKNYTTIYSRCGNLLVHTCFIILAIIIMIKLRRQGFGRKSDDKKRA